MSFFIHASTGGFPLHNNINMPGYGQNDESMHPTWNSVIHSTRYHDTLWPRSQLTGAAIPEVATNLPVWEYHEPAILNSTGGVISGKKIIGITKNSAGAALGSVTVKLFNSSTGLLVDSQVSDASGNYTLIDPNNVTCFVVAYLAGSPDVAGTSLNNLAGV